MKHKNRIILNMQGLVLLVLIPACWWSPHFLGWVVYTDLYSIIMAGFDRKLMAVSSVVGSFVQGEDLQQIAELSGRSADLPGMMTAGHCMVIISMKTAYAQSIRIPVRAPTSTFPALPAWKNITLVPAPA